MVSRRSAPATTIYLHSAAGRYNLHLSPLPLLVRGLFYGRIDQNASRDHVMPNNQGHDPRVSLPANRLAQAITLQVDAVEESPPQGAAPTAPPVWTPSKTSNSVSAVITNANGATSFECTVDGGTTVVPGLTVSGLNPEQTYPLQVRGSNEFGGPTAWSAVQNITTNAAGSATLIFEETFEGALQSGSTLANGAEVVTSAKMSGSKTCRVNLKDSANDPLVTTPSNSSTYEYNGTLLRDTASDVVTAEWDFRFDDADWNGTLEAISDPAGVVLKGGYFGAYQDKVNGFYPVLKGGSNGGINLGDNGGRGDGGWENSSWVNDPGRLLWYMSTGHNWGAGTGVHRFRVTVDHSHPDYQQLRMWIDGNLATNGTYAPDGIIRLPKTWRFESFSTCYTNDGNVNLSSDRTETACGIEFDNVRIYEGEPA